MNKRRFLFALALPLLLGVLLGAVKWKQLHPTPTQRDLAERAHLREAKIINLVYEGNYISIPVDKFKATLDEFYLMDKFPTSYSTQSPTTQTTIVIRKDKDESFPLAQIDLDSPASYFPAKPDGTNPTIALHPVTERRLRDFVALYGDAK